jgi:hypothetical protein
MREAFRMVEDAGHCGVIGVLKPTVDFSLGSTSPTSADAHLSAKETNANGSLESSVPTTFANPQPSTTVGAVGGYTDAHLSTKDGNLVVTIDGDTKTFKFSSDDDDDKPYKFHLNCATKQPPEDTHKDDWVAWVIPRLALLLVAILPPLFNFGLSRFRKQRSTVAQRAWLIAWMCANQVSYIPFAILCIGRPGYRFSYGDPVARFVIVFSILLSIASVGGYVEVVMMFTETGSCSTAM